MPEAPPKLASSISPELSIISQWRRDGHHAGSDAIQRVKESAWCRMRLGDGAPVTKGDLALMMEHAPDRDIRDWCRKLVLQGGASRPA